MSINVLRDIDWLKKHYEELKGLFPEVWTHSSNINFLAIRFRLKLMGVDYRSEKEFTSIMVYFTKIGVCEVKQLAADASHIRRGTGQVKGVGGA